MARIVTVQPAAFSRQLSAFTLLTFFRPSAFDVSREVIEDYPSERVV
jgi:hypothetical protein